MFDYLNTKTQTKIQTSNVITSTFKDVMILACIMLAHNYVVKINWKGYLLNTCDIFFRSYNFQLFTVVCMYKTILEKICSRGYTLLYRKISHM